VSLGLGVAATSATFSFSRLFEFLFFSVVIGIVVSSFVQAAITRATVSASEGRKATFGECLSAALRVVLPLVAMAILSGLAIMVGMFLLLIPGIILFLMWSVASPAMVIERGGIIGSLSRSAELTKGSRWKILAMFLVLMIAYWLLSLLIGVVGLTAYRPSTVAGLTIANLIGSIILGTAFNTAAGALWPSLYVELRHAKEGTSIESLEQVFA
jgi:flagellar biosynthesis protein FlhB